MVYGSTSRSRASQDALHWSVLTNAKYYEVSEATDLATEYPDVGIIAAGEEVAAGGG